MRVDLCSLAIAIALLGACTGCERGAHGGKEEAARGPASATSAPSPLTDAPLTDAPLTDTPLTPEILSNTPRAAPPLSTDALSDADFNRLLRELSEHDRPFISDNLVSNETSYLQVAPLLERSAPGDAAYLGVGPEQNFTYVALAQPKLAFIIDIRRANLLLHLLYKAAFELATSRTHFLSLLLARSYDAAQEPRRDASIEQVLDSLAKLDVNSAAFLGIHERLVDRLTEVRGVELDEQDRRTLVQTHRAFFDAQLALAFALDEDSRRRYPTLEELLLTKDARGRSSHYLGSEAAFRMVQQLQLENRIVPVVGDFAGKHALPALAQELERRSLSVGVFYLSNVEQYLRVDVNTWGSWRDNLLRLPVTEHTLLLRAYLDQGERHPLQLPGLRTASVLQRLDAAQRRQLQDRPRSWLALASQGVLRDNP